MDILEVKYSKRFNIGDYQHEEYTVLATLEENETADWAFAVLKERVERAHLSKVKVEEKLPKVEEQLPKLEEAAKEEEAPVVKKAKGRPAGAKNKPKDEPPKEEMAEEEKVEEAPKKTFKKVGTPYSRQNEIHKKMFAEKLAMILPSWKETEAGKNKARLASQTLEGKEFLDASGTVLPEFIGEMRDLLL
jgi:hypothetical protein